MPTNVTRYQLLISCPGDIKDEVQIIKDCVSKFNSAFDTLDITVQEKHWSKDAFPETGAKPQSILNKQLVDKCDAAVAIFWTRFGTPTDEYHSGSEEEIERMIASGKNVFMYFSNVSIPPSDIDAEQYKKVQEFKERFKEKGLYWEYSTNEEFAEKFYAHITQYFLSEAKVREITDAKKPEFEVELIDVEQDSVPNEAYKYSSPRGLIRRKVLSEDDILEEIADCVTVDDISAYNDALPSEEDIQTYNKALKLYEDVQNNRYDFKLTVSNIGTIMANEIYVDLEFPEGVLVYRESDAESIKEPKNRPEMPEDPVWKAYKEKQKQKNKAVLGNLDAFMTAENFALKMLGISQINNNALNLSYSSMPVASFKIPYPISVDYTIRKNKTLTLHMNDLLHTRQYESDKFSLIFTSYGEFKIKYSVICAELEKPIEGKIIINAEYDI